MNVRNFVLLMVIIPLFSSFFKLKNYSYLTRQDSSLIGVGNGIVDNNFIGGIYQCNLSLYNEYNATKRRPGIVVKNVQQLINAISNSQVNDFIYLDDKIVFNLSGYENIKIPKGLTLASGRGVNKSKGALILTNTLKTWPLFITTGNDITFKGLRIQGPDGSYVNPAIIQRLKSVKLDGQNPITKTAEAKMKTYGVGNSRAIVVQNKNVTIENCEIYNWTHAGIGVLQGGEANIIFNYIHDNRRYGLGYGILLDKGFALVKANLFRNNRHAISGSGALGSGYTATFNIVLPNEDDISHQFDMHGGKDRKDGTSSAGEKIEILNNLIFYNKNPGILIRGVPSKASDILRNVFVKFSSIGKFKFAVLTVPGYSTQSSDSSFAFKQVNNLGNISYKNNTFLILK